MKVIGAGLPRTATTTQMFALEALGHRPLLPHARPARRPRVRPAAVGGRWPTGAPDWERIFGDAAVDGGLALGALLPGADGALPRGQGAAERARPRGMGEQHARDGVGDLPRRLGHPPRLRGARRRRSAVAPLHDADEVDDAGTRRSGRSPARPTPTRASATRWTAGTTSRRADGARRAPARVEPERRLGAAVRVPRGATCRPSRCRA